MNGHELKEEGWRPYELEQPPYSQTVEFARDERVNHQLPWFGCARDFPPEFNVAGLFWRPVQS